MKDILERTLLRRVGEAIGKFKMIRDGDCVAVAVSGGKDSLTLLDALRLLQKRSPAKFTLCAFTVEQGKFLRPIEPLGGYMKAHDIPWTYFRDAPSLRLLDEQPEHGCDLCSRYRRRAVYEIARGLEAKVIAFGHTADDFCEALLRNIFFTGRISALPPVTYSRERDFRIIRPLVYVTEQITSAYVEQNRFPTVPCGCSQKTGTVRRCLRDFLADLKKQQPHVLENILSAMGHLDTRRLLDARFLSLPDGAPENGEPRLLPILSPTDT